MYQKIIELAEAVTPEMIAYRRDFHKYAESGWLEMRTASIIARRLTELGYEVLMGDAVCKTDARLGVPSEEVLEKNYNRAIEQGADPEFVKATRGGYTGVIGILRCGEGPTVAMRFDIDALGVNESTEDTHLPAREGFASVNAGTMHACGHDGHAASGLGVAKVLMDIKDHLHGTVKLIFQPGEEGLRGAKSIVEAGHLDDADYVLGNHTTGVGNTDRDIIPGSYGCLASFKYDVIFRGLAAHAGSSGHLGKNALLAAAAAVTNLYAIPRHGAGASRINVGKLIAGSGRNVIADEAFMEMEVRGETTAINEYMSAYAMRVLEAAAAMHDCTVEVRLMGAAESLVSDMPLVERVADVCGNKLGMKLGEKMTIKLSGSEDFSYMVNRVQSHGGQGVFMRVCSPVTSANHKRDYDFDESYLTKSVKAFCGMAYDLMK